MIKEAAHKATQPIKQFSIAYSSLAKVQLLLPLPVISLGLLLLINQPTFV